MSRTPLVSTIIIFLNAERFLDEAIESVFQQRYPHWELILVDDGSSDESTHIARRLAQREPARVRYVEHAGHLNRGMSASRNLGIAQARGAYVAFLDADDVWLPQKLAEQVAILEREPEAAMLYGRTQYWYSWTGHPEDRNRDELTPLSVEPNALISPPTLLVHFLKDENVFPCTCSIIIRREVFQDIGLFEERFRNTYEDMVFHAKVFLSAPVYVADACWDRYRLHEHNSWKTAIQTGQYDPRAPNPARETYLTWLEAYLKEKAYASVEVWEALRQALWPYRHPRRHAFAAVPRRLTANLKRAAKKAARRVLSEPTRLQLRARLIGNGDAPRVGMVRFGSLRRVTPISQAFGFDRGQPIDRYYIERFLDRYATMIQGHVLEVADNAYTRQYGRDRVSKSDVLDIDPGNPHATIVTDLTHAAGIASDTFDCILLTQTLHLVYEAHSAVQTLHRILKPGGVLLATFPGISQISHYEWGDREHWYWGFTTHSAQKMFEEAFSPENLTIEHHGNVLTAAAFLHGLAAEELSRSELDHADPDYQVLLTVKAVKPTATS